MPREGSNSLNSSDASTILNPEEVCNGRFAYIALKAGFLDAPHPQGEKIHSLRLTPSVNTICARGLARRKGLTKMDDTYRINVAKTEFREAFNRGDVDQLLSVFDEEGFTDMSKGGPTHYGKPAREGLRERSTELFAEYSVKLAVIINEIVILGDTAYDFGSHEFTLRPKNGGETIHKRHRYFEVWKKTPSGEWKISVFINNADVREELGGRFSHWFLSEEEPGNTSSPTRS
jgi:ketosteroid isomerase-like protein